MTVSVMHIEDPSAMTREEYQRFWDGEGELAQRRGGLPKAAVARNGNRLTLRVPGQAAGELQPDFGWFAVVREDSHDRRLFDDTHALALMADREHALMFSVLSEFVLREVHAGTENPAAEVARSLLQWKRYLRSFRNGPSQDWGLHGELLVLEQLVEAAGEEAVGWWTGPDLSPKDFTCGGYGLEVKTAGENSASVRIHGPEQLTPSGHLMIVRLRRDEEGETLDDVVARLRTKLKDSPQADRFEKLLEKSGFEPRQDSHRVTVSRVNVEDMRNLPNVQLPESNRQARRISRIEFSLDVQNILTELPIAGVGRFFRENADA